MLNFGLGCSNPLKKFAEISALIKFSIESKPGWPPMCSIMLFYLVQSSVISPTMLLCIPSKTTFQDHLDYGTHGWSEEVLFTLVSSSIMSSKSSFRGSSTSCFFLWSCLFGNKKNNRFGVPQSLTSLSQTFIPPTACKLNGLTHLCVMVAWNLSPIVPHTLTQFDPPSHWL